MKAVHPKTLMGIVEIKGVWAELEIFFICVLKDNIQEGIRFMRYAMVVMAAAKKCLGTL